MTEKNIKDLMTKYHDLINGEIKLLIDTTILYAKSNYCVNGKCDLVCSDDVKILSEIIINNAHILNTCFLKCRIDLTRYIEYVNIFQTVMDDKLVSLMILNIAPSETVDLLYTTLIMKTHLEKNLKAFKDLTESFNYIIGFVVPNCILKLNTIIHDVTLTPRYGIQFISLKDHIGKFLTNINQCKDILLAKQNVKKLLDTKKIDDALLIDDDIYKVLDGLREEDHTFQYITIDDDVLSTSIITEVKGEALFDFPILNKRPPSSRTPIDHEALYKELETNPNYFV